MNMIRKSKSGLSLIPVIFLSFIITSCGQHSIFYDISHEPEPRSPLISGSPTNMVLVDNALFVGSRMGNRIFRYSGPGGRPVWNTIPAPGGSIGDIATDGTNLYALVFPGGNPLTSSVIKRFNIARNVWDTEYTVSLFSIQTIFGVDGKIFAGAMFRQDHLNYAIFSLDPSSPTLTLMMNNTSLLTGAADSSRGVFLSTAGGGIFRYSGGLLETRPVSGSERANIIGIIDTGESVVAVSSDGTVYFLTAQGGAFSSFSTRLTFTGALSTWGDRNNQWRPTLLLAGIRGRGTSIVNGYREIVLDRSGIPSQIIRVPGDESPSSVRNRARYSASIGQHPVETILQLPDVSRGGPVNYSIFTADPDWEPPIFASTSRSGLWSLRDGVWNAEE